MNLDLRECHVAVAESRVEEMEILNGALPQSREPNWGSKGYPTSWQLLEKEADWVRCVMNSMQKQKAREVSGPMKMEYCNRFHFPGPQTRGER